MKIVINRCYGGFALSPAAIEMYLQLKGYKYKKKVANWNYSHYYIVREGDDDEYFIWSQIDRHDPILVQVVEELGEAASGDIARLEIFEVSDNTPYKINEYDGMETVSEFGDMSDGWIIP